MDKRFTIAPVGVSYGADAEFCDLEGLQARFAIKRSLAYQLIGDGKIRAVSLRKNGRTRGKKLIEIQSVRDFLAKQPNK